MVDLPDLAFTVSAVAWTSRGGARRPVIIFLSDLLRLLLALHGNDDPEILVVYQFEICHQIPFPSHIAARILYA
jgi:hypothetical protein